MRLLYRVLVSKEIYVLADDPTDASKIAEKNIVDEGAGWESAPDLVSKLADVPEIVRFSLPWGIGSDATIEQWFKREADGKP